jgi:hypothetical protein
MGSLFNVAKRVIKGQSQDCKQKTLKNKSEILYIDKKTKLYLCIVEKILRLQEIRYANKGAV